MNHTDAWTLAVIVGLAVVTVVTRSFFLFSSRPWPLPEWANRGLQFAPIAALSAVIAPELFMVQGQVLDTWHDARWIAALAATLVYFWRHNVLLTITVGMAVYLPLHVALGW